MGMFVTRKLQMSLISILLATGHVLYSQSVKSGTHASATNSLAKPVDWGFYNARLFHDDPRQITFHLATSWIPGENHKGMLRYQLSAGPAVPSDNNGAGFLDVESVETLMKRVHGCVITLNLYDKGGFILRKDAVAFSFGVDDQVRVRSLYANDACQMDAQDYRDLIGNSAGSGSWSVSWDCGLER